MEQLQAVTPAGMSSSFFGLGTLPLPDPAGHTDPSPSGQGVAQRWGGEEKDEGVQTDTTLR